KTKHIRNILIVFISLSLLSSCGETSKKVTTSKIQVSPTEGEDFSSDTYYKEYETKTGKTIIISVTHPVGQSLSTIEISTKDFKHNYTEIYENRDPISDVLIGDLDGNGFDEIYIITTSVGSGSYGTVLGFASNKDKSLSMINFPKIQAGDQNFEGYMGHDTFKIENQKLVRIFPVYNKGDTNQNPTGKTRKLVYGLFPGEAMWQLRVESLETLNSLLEEGRIKK
ncbi:MAG: hypothetical protein PVG67_06680, partial [Desulfobacterales bacterium]